VTRLTANAMAAAATTRATNTTSSDWTARRRAPADAVGPLGPTGAAGSGEPCSVVLTTGGAYLRSPAPARGKPRTLTKRYKPECANLQYVATQ
jgi:hypothetical protein